MREVHLLLIEDSPTDRLLAEAALADTWADCHVHSVDNGLDALDFLYRRGAWEDAPRVDLVLLDLNLPGLDGRTLLRRMKADPLLQRIPVVVLTVSGATEDVAAAYRAQASSYIEKPVDFADYRRALLNLRNYWLSVATLPQPEAMLEEPEVQSDSLVVLVVDGREPRRISDLVTESTSLAATQVVAAGTLEAAVGLIDELVPDVLIVDTALPDTDRLPEVRRHAPELPILAILDAGVTPSPDVRNLADDYLVRDNLHPLTVARAVEVAIERRHRRTRLVHTHQLALLARLAGNVAHDFNNLLTIIRSGVDVIRARGLPDDAHAVVDAIAEAATRGEGLTRQLLALGRRRPLEEAFVDLAEHVRSRQPLLERVLRSTVELTVDAPKTLVPVRIDPRHLDQLLLNLVSNASDAMPDGGEIHLVVRQLADGAELVVQDDGTGIATEDLEQVFQPFFTTKSMEEGSGLGLSSARDVMQRVGGDIRIDSELGRGTTVALTFPATDATGAGRATARSIPEPVESPRVVIVEDEPALLKILTRMLHQAGFAVTPTGDLVSARAAWQAHADTCLVLADVTLAGGESGLDVVNLVREDGLDVPVLFMSGHPDEALLPKHDAYLAKPFSQAQLLDLVNEVLAKGA